MVAAGAAIRNQGDALDELGLETLETNSQGANSWGAAHLGRAASTGKMGLKEVKRKRSPSHWRPVLPALLPAWAGARGLSYLVTSASAKVAMQTSAPATLVGAGSAHVQSCPK